MQVFLHIFSQLSPLLFPNFSKGEVPCISLKIVQSCISYFQLSFFLIVCINKIFIGHNQHESTFCKAYERAFKQNKILNTSSNVSYCGNVHRETCTKEEEENYLLLRICFSDLLGAFISLQDCFRWMALQKIISSSLGIRRASQFCGF